MINSYVKRIIFNVVVYLLTFYSLSFNCFYLQNNPRKVAEYTRKNLEYYSRTTTPKPDPSVPKAIVYYRYDNGENELRSIIDNLIYDLESKTCLKFSKKTDKNDKDVSLVLGWLTNTFTTNSDSNNNKVNAVFYEECRNIPGCIKSQVLYAFGMVPPHKRSDRDSYITVDKKNVSEKCKADYLLDKLGDQYKHLEVGGYDFGSVGHMKRYFCHKDKQPPISAKIEVYNDMMGRDDGLSFNDHKFINTHYCKSEECEDTVSKQCQHDGYKDPNNCKKCLCPNGFEGDFCERLKASDEDCKGPRRYGMENAYNISLRGKVNCYYHFETTDWFNIEFNIKRIKTSTHVICTENTGFELKLQKDIGATGLCLCNEHTNIVVKSQSNYAYLFFNGQEDFYIDVEYRRVYDNDSVNNYYKQHSNPFNLRIKNNF
uniref:Metalloendopeptidase n=1 Tax=Parastrongyloides trichosuri TaxID=131310 RepID=A0A0N4Z1K1_PARTI